MKFISFLVALLVTVGFLISNNQADTADCRGGDTFPGLDCLHYTQKPGRILVPPSPYCCEVAKKVDFVCFCKNVNRDQQIILSMEKIAYVAALCHNPIPGGTKCGNYTVPAYPPVGLPSFKPENV